MQSRDHVAEVDKKVVSVCGTHDASGSKTAASMLRLIPRIHDDLNKSWEEIF